MAWMDNVDNHAVAKDEIDLWGSVEGFFGDLARDPLTTGARTGAFVGRSFKAGFMSAESSIADIDREQLEKAARYYDDLDAWKAREAERVAAGKGGFMGRLGFNTVDVGTLRMQLPGDTDPMPQPTMRLLDEAANRNATAFEKFLGIPGADYKRSQRDVVIAIKPLIQDKMREAVRVSEAKNKAVEEMMPQTGDFLADSLLGGVRAISEMTPLIVSAIASRGKTIPTVVMAGQVYYNEYATGREKGLEIDQATERAVLQAGVEAVSERISLGIVDNVLKDGGPLALRFTKGLILEQGQEQVATMGGRLVDWAYLEKDKTIQEFIDETPRAMLQTALTTLVASSGMQATFLAADYATQKFLGDSVMTDPSKGDQFIANVMEKFAKANLGKRSPEKAADLVNKIVEGTGAETVVIDLDGLAQSLTTAGMDVRETLTQLGVDPDAIGELGQLMGTAEIPMGRLAAPSAQLLSAQIIPHMRLATEDLTPFQKTELEGIAELAKRYTTELKEDIARDASKLGAFVDVQEQIYTAAKASGLNLTEEQYRHNANIAATELAYIAMKRGQDVRETFAERGQKIMGRDGAAQGSAALEQKADEMRTRLDEAWTSSRTMQPKEAARVWKNAVEEFKTFAASASAQELIAASDMLLDRELLLKMEAPKLEKMMKTLGLPAPGPTMALNEMRDAITAVLRSANSDQADSSDPLAQSLPKSMSGIAKMTTEQMGEWYVDNVQETRQDFPDGTSRITLRFKTDDAATAQDSVVNLQVENGKVAADLVFRGTMGGPALQLPPKPDVMTPELEAERAAIAAEIRTRSDTAMQMFRKAIVAMRHWAALEQPSAMTFSGSSVDHEKLYNFFLSRMEFEGYTNHVVEAIIGGITTRTADQSNQPETSGETFVGPMVKFVVLKDGEDLSNYAETEASKGRTGRDLDGNATQGYRAVTTREIGPSNSPDRGVERGGSRAGGPDPGGDGTDAENLTQPRRGGYDPKTREMSFSGISDASTFLHENSHWFLATLEELAPTEKWAADDLAEINSWYQSIRETPKMQQIRARYSVVPDPAGGVRIMYQPPADMAGETPAAMRFERVASMEEAQAKIEWRERQEAWAETTEEYFMTGESPTPRLKQILRDFKNWLVQVYRGMLPGERANLTPEIKSMMDRILAVDVEVDASASEVFRDARKMADEMLGKGIITPRQHKLVGDRLDKAREEVKEELLARVMQEKLDAAQASRATERSIILGNLARAFDKSPVGRAFNWLAYGEWKGDLPGEPATEGEAEAVRSDEMVFQFETPGSPEYEAAVRKYGVEGMVWQMPDGSDGPRKARARAMGFNVDNPLYHGTDVDFDAFRTTIGTYGEGVYLTDSPDEAGRYASGYRLSRQFTRAEGSGPNIIATYVRGRIANINDYYFALEEVRSERSDIDENSSSGAREVYRLAGEKLAAQGFAGHRVQEPNAQFAKAIVIYDPSSIRSVNAAFDPDNSDSAVLLGQNEKDKQKASTGSSVDRLQMVAERGVRDTAENVRISAEEREAMEASAKATGVPIEEIEAAVRKTKAAHPVSQGWEPVIYSRTTTDKKEEGKEGEDKKVTHEYKQVPYGFALDASGNTLAPGTGNYTRRVNSLAKSMTEEVRSILRRARAGDANARNIIAQAAWYKAMRKRLRQEFGGLGDLFADLLGATSPNTPVRDNWFNAVEALRRASRGDFDELIVKWEAYYDQIDALELDLRAWFNNEMKGETDAEGNVVRAPKKKKEIKNSPEYLEKITALKELRKFPQELLPKKENEANYGFNGRNVARAMVDLWRVIRDADPDINRGGTAPKALNFSGNLIGFRTRATIDVWAARILQRLTGRRRIPSVSEPTVSGVMRQDGSTTLSFALGQDVFSAAVKRIRSDTELNTDPTLAEMNDDDLQALVWFIEKEIWTINNWTNAAGEGGSFELEADLTGTSEQEQVRILRRILDASPPTADLKTAELSTAEALEAIEAHESKHAAAIEELRKLESGETEAYPGSVKRMEALGKIARPPAEHTRLLNRVARAKERLEEFEARKIAARGLLAGLERQVDRFVGGLSIQMSQDTQGIDFVPGDADMARLGAAIREAIYAADDGATVLGSKTLSTQGRYGSVERSLDLEIVAREGYDANAVWKEILRQGQEAKQDSVFLSRVLRKTEEVDPLVHRPGVEIYFREAADRAKLETILAELADPLNVRRPWQARKDAHVAEALRKWDEQNPGPLDRDERKDFADETGNAWEAYNPSPATVWQQQRDAQPDADRAAWEAANPNPAGAEFLTVVVDGRRLADTMAGQMPAAVGVRLQYIPEFEQRYGMDNLSELDDKALKDKVNAKAEELAALSERVAGSVEGVSFAGQFWYETQTAFSSEYQEKIDALTTGTSEKTTGNIGGPQWTGQSIRAGLESADRQLRETSRGEPGVGVLGGIEGAEDGTANETLSQTKAPIFYSALSRFIENNKTTKAPASQWKGMITNAPGIKVEEVEMSGVMDWLDIQGAQGTEPQMAPGTTFQQGENGKLIGYKVMRVDDEGNLVSGADSRLTYSGAVGESLTAPRAGTYLSNTPEYVATHYGGLADNEVLLTLEFDQADVLAGALSDREPEIGVSSAKIVKRTPLIEGEIPPSASPVPVIKARQVTREALAAFVAANGVTVEEVKYSSSLADNPRLDAIQREMLPLLEENDRLMGEINDLGSSPEADALREAFNRNVELINDLRAERFQIVNSDVDSTKWSYYTLPGGENYTELLLTVPGVDYKDSHFPGVKGTIAHVRLKERIGPNGERVLALEEIQSGIHQKGREDGYDKSGPLRVQFEADAAKLKAELKASGVWDAFSSDMMDPSQKRPFNPEEESSYVWSSTFEGWLQFNPEHNAHKEASLALGEVRRAIYANQGAVPNAPFKNNAWVDLVLKRMIRYAAENKFDSVAWIPGNIQNGRVVEADDNRGDFYDKIVPNAANKLGKKYGARVEKTPGLATIPYDPRPQGVSDADWFNMETTPTDLPVDFWTLPITPELREAALNEGFPLFQPRKFNPPGHGAVAPPTDIPPVRLDLKLVKDLYGEEAVRALPAAVRKRSSTSSNVTDIIQQIEAVRKVLSVKRKGPQTLTQFIMQRQVKQQDGTKRNRQWGIKGADGELRAMGFERLINNKSGMTLDAMRELAEEAGFIRAETGGARATEYGDFDATPLDLLDALAREAKGEAVVRIGEEVDNKELDDAKTWASWLEQNGVDIYEASPKKLRASVDAMLRDTDESLVSPDKAAEMFGFENGEELLRALAEVGNRDAFLNKMADQKMVEEFGDMMSDGTLQAEAAEAARLDIAHRQTEIELEALARAVGQQASANYAKQMARDIIAMRTVKEIAAYERDLNNERQFGKQALRLVEKGDYPAALKAKQRQLVSMQLYIEGKKASEKIEKRRLDLMKYLTSEGRRDKIAGDYLEQIEDILDRFELRVSKQGPSVQRERMSAAKYVADMDAAGRQDEVAPEARLLAELNEKMVWRNMTGAEVDHLVGTIQNLAHLGRTKDSLLKAAEKRKFRAVIDALTDRMNLTGKLPGVTRERSPTKTTTEVLVDTLREGHSWLMRPEHQARSLDGGELGPVWEAIFRPISEAGDVESRMMREATQLYREAWDKFTSAERNAMSKRSISVPELPGIGKRFTKLDLISVALNWGVIYNREVLMEGYGWNADQVEAALFRVLTDKDWDFVESIWEISGMYKAEAFQVEKDMTGVEPRAVEGISFTLPSGRKINGKYYHIQYDASQPGKMSRRQAKDNDAEALSSHRKSRTKAMTKNGGLIERKGSGGRKVKLGLAVFERALAETVHDIAFRRAVYDVGRIVADDQFADTYQEVAGMENYRQLNVWLKDVAMPPMEVLDPIVKAFAHVRRNVPLAVMGYKVGTALIQPTGLLAAMPLVGHRRVLVAVAQSFANPDRSMYGAWKQVASMSEFMRDRVAGYERDVRETTTAMTKGGALDIMRRNAFTFITGMDIAVSVPTWMAAYGKAMDGKVKGIDAGNQEDAVAFADSIIRRTQTAGKTQDLSRFQRGGEFQKQISMIFGYFNNLYSLSAQQTLDMRRGNLSKAQYAWHMTVLFVAIPLFAELLAGRLIPDEDDEDEATIEGNIATTLISNFSGMFPGIRDAVGLNLKPEFGYRMSPTGKFIEDIGKTLGLPAQLLLDEERELTEADIKRVVNTAGALTGLPSAQINITGNYIIDVLEGEEDPMADPADALSEGLVRNTR